MGASEGAGTWHGAVRAAEGAALLHPGRWHGAFKDGGVCRRSSNLQRVGLGKLRCVV